MKGTTRSCAASLLGLALAAALGGAAAAAPGDVHRVTAERVNLRSGPSDASTVRSTVEQGDELVELRSEGGWLGVRVMRTGEEGWIFGELVERVSQSQLGGPAGAGIADAGFETLSEGFDALIARMGEQLGYPLVDSVEEAGGGALRVTPSPEFLLYGGREAHMAAAVAIYQMWKNHQNQGPVTVTLLDGRGQDYIAIADEADGPRLALQPPAATAEAE